MKYNIKVPVSCIVVSFCHWLSYMLDAKIFIITANEYISVM